MKLKNFMYEHRLAIIATAMIVLILVNITITLKVFNFTIVDTVHHDCNHHDENVPKTDIPTESHDSKQVSAPNMNAAPNGVAIKVSSKDGGSVSEYVNRFSKVAIDEMKLYKIPASITLAQGVIESGIGRSDLAVNSNNHFGIKCFSKKCSKGHCVNKTDDSHKDFFRVFSTPWESFREHSKVLLAPRYRECFKCGDYKCWSYCLERSGYASDKNYAESLIKLIRTYKLDKYD
jgi:flagellum-specific peptidoglycan hydrolase FlgJ